MTTFNARALASLVTVAGNALSRRLSVILTALVQVVEGNDDEELSSAVDEALHASLSSVSDDEGLHTLMMLLISWSVKVNCQTLGITDYVGQGET